MTQIEGHYDSNIFLEPTNEKADFIYKITPKAILEIPFGLGGRHLFEASYAAEAGIYSKYNGQNYINQDVAANLNLILPSGFINAQEKFRDTIDRSDPEFTSEIRRVENTASATIGTEFNKFAFEAGYENFLRRYRSGEYKNIDYAEHFFTGTMYYQLFQKTRALVDYTYGLIDYFNSNSRSGRYNQVMGGLKGELTGKSDIIARLGYQNRQYNASSRNGFDGFIAGVVLNTRFSERTEMWLRYTRTPVESIYASNSYYAANRFSLDISQKIINDFSFLGGFRLDANGYPTEASGTDKKRRDNIITVDAAIQYSYRDLMKFKVGYQYKEDFSNISNEDYDRHIASFSANLLF